MKLPTVESMQSPNGNDVPNQFQITTNDSVIFQSYQTIIVVIKQGETYLDEGSWNCSTTTSKYRNLFLGETTKETKAKIKSGEYKLKDLNK